MNGTMTIKIHQQIPRATPPPCDIMALAAHPDDTEFGAAGTVIRWADEGQSVVYAIATNGDKGTSDPGLTPVRLAEIRQAEQARAAQLTGAREVVYMGYPDQGLEDSPALRKDIVRLLRLYRPRILVTSDPYRRYLWHRDHRIIGQVAMDAVFPYARDHLAYPDLIDQDLAPHKVAEIYFWGTEDINYQSDITATFDRKIEALRCHASQMKEFKHSDPVAWLRERCREMAAGTDFELAEGFHRVQLPL
jgi:LmbE family N-acetylglucosaminyl deacetylase